MSWFDAANERTAREILAWYPKPKSAVIPLLHLAQEQEGWVTPDAMTEIAELTGITAAEVPVSYTHLTLPTILRV